MNITLNSQPLDQVPDLELQSLLQQLTQYEEVRRVVTAILCLQELQRRGVNDYLSL